MILKSVMRTRTERIWTKPHITCDSHKNERKTCYFWNSWHYTGWFVETYLLYGKWHNLVLSFGMVVAKVMRTAESEKSEFEIHWKILEPTIFLSCDGWSSRKCPRYDVDTFLVHVWIVPRTRLCRQRSTVSCLLIKLFFPYLQRTAGRWKTILIQCSCGQVCNWGEPEYDMKV